ncbi:MAG TPA: endonuclease III, partial [bacterium]|nr:endonuclease III [bacterium]
SGGPAEGIIVDLHVVRVAPRVGVTKEEKPEKIEKDLMAVVEKKYWGDVGMAISFLGREICRPTNPKCEECPINENCSYFQNQIRSAKSKKN